MKSSIMLLGLFAAMAANLFSFALGWDPASDYEKTEMVYATRCPQCGGYPSSPGVIQPDTLCEERYRSTPCVTDWFKEKRGAIGVLMALAQNPQLLLSVVFLFAFEIASFWAAKKMPEWEPMVMASIALVSFLSGLVLFFVLRGWLYVLICLFLAMAALISFELQSEGTAKDVGRCP
jgi:hypothetical protein